MQWEIFQWGGVRLAAVGLFIEGTRGKGTAAGLGPAIGIHIILAVGIIIVEESEYEGHGSHHRYLHHTGGEYYCSRRK